MSPASLATQCFPAGTPSSKRFPSKDGHNGCSQTRERLRASGGVVIRNWFFVVCSIVGFLGISTQAFAEGPCGSKDTKDQVEDKAIQRLGFMGTTLPKDEPSSIPEGVYATSYYMRQILRGEYEVDLSETYQVDQSFSVVVCKGKLGLSVPSKVSTWVQIEYKVITTDDGKSMVEWNPSVVMTALEYAAMRLSAKSKAPNK